MLEELKNKLGEEIERLTHELQVTLPKAIQKAVEHGDLRENSEYKSALERQQFVQARLNHLTRRYGELSKIDLSDVPTDRVGFGSFGNERTPATAPPSPLRRPRLSFICSRVRMSSISGP